MPDMKARAAIEDVVEKPGEAWVAETPLTAGAIGLTGAVMQHVSHVVLALGMCLVQLAMRLPSAGAYFTYVTRTVGARAGFLTGWMFVLYAPIVPGPILAYFGFILEGELKSNYGWTWFHWWMFVIVAIPAVTALAYLGIKLSVRTIVVVGALEFLIVLALGLFGLGNPGPGGFTLSSFDYGVNPRNIATASGFALAVVFTVQGLTGWE